MKLTEEQVKGLLIEQAARIGAQDAELAALRKVRLLADVLCDDCYTTSIDWNKEWVEDRDALRIALQEYDALKGGKE